MSPREKNAAKVLARLESKVDALESEISQLDLLLRRSGFTNGISTLRDTVETLLNEVEGKFESDDDSGDLFV